MRCRWRRERPAGLTHQAGDWSWAIGPSVLVEMGSSHKMCRLDEEWRSSTASGAERTEINEGEEERSWRRFNARYVAVRVSTESRSAWH